MNIQSRIYIAGHKGMVGSSCFRLLKNLGYKNIIYFESKEKDLRNQMSVEELFKKDKPEYVINAAARVGGIYANNEYPYEFLYDNLMIQSNLIHASYKFDVKKFIFLGSSCIYPKLSSQPIKEEYLLEGQLEPTNQWYAVAKISGVKLIESLKIKHNKDFISLMPTNLYGPGDNYDLKKSHVIPALIRKIYEAKLNSTNVELWGTGKPLREFLHVDDLASAIIFSLNNYLPDSLYNVGSGDEISISQLAEMISKKLNYKNQIIWNKNMPDGTPRKLLDTSKLTNLGWNSKININDGLSRTIDDFLENVSLYV